MQDWERTQELAAEAQDSAGASAAQYAVYAQGMEAQLTKLKSSWQEFIQSITSSEFIVNAVKFIGNSLDKINDFLEKAPSLIKNGVILLGGYLLVTQGIEKVRQGLGMQSNRELQLQNMQIDNEEYLAKKQKERLENETKELDEQIKKIKEKREEELKSTKAEKQAELAQLEESNLQEDNDVYNDLVATEGEEAVKNSGLFTEEQLNNWARMVELKREIQEIDTNIQNIERITSEEEEQLLADKNQKLQELKTQEENIAAAQEARNKLTKESNNPLIQRLNLLQQQLIQEQRLTEEKRKQLEVDLEKADDSQKPMLQKMIQKYKQQELALDNKINKVETQKNNIVKKQQGLVSTIGLTLSTSIKTSLSQITSSLGPIGTVLNDIVSSVVKWGGQLLMNLATSTAKKKQEEEVTEEVKEQADAEGTKTVLKTINVGATAAEQKAEEEVTEEVEEQTGKMSLKNILTGLSIIFKKKEKKETENVGKEESENTAKKGVNTFLDIVSAFKSAGPVGIIAGIAIATALVGTIAGISVAVANGGFGTGNVSEAADEKTEESISKKQNDLYQAKKDNSSLKSQRDEYNELASKSYKTAEEKERMQSIEESLQQSDEEFENLSGSLLMAAVNSKIAENENIAARETEASYNLALKMGDLTDSVVGQQAIQNKIVSTQEDLIESNYLLIDANESTINNIEEKTSALASDFAANLNNASYDGVDFSEATDNYGVWDYVKNIGLSIGAGAGAGAGIGAIAGGGVGALPGLVIGAVTGLVTGVTNSIIADVKNANIREQEAAARNEYINTFAIKSTDFVTAMETYLDDVDEEGNSIHSLTDQIKKYSENVAHYIGDDEYMKSTIAGQYETLDFLATVTQGNDIILNNIDELTELGVLTTDSILELTDALAALNAEAENVKEGAEALTEDSHAYKAISGILTSMGLINTSLDDLESKAYATVRQDSNGNDQRYGKNTDENNTLKYRDTSGKEIGKANSNSVKNFLESAVPYLQNLGLGGYSIETIVALNDVYSGNLSAEKLLEDITTRMVENHDSNLSTAENVYNAIRGSDWEAESARLKAAKVEAQKEYDDVYEKFQKGEATSDELTQAKNVSTAASEAYSSINNTLTETTRNLAGYMSTDELGDLLARAQSGGENVQSIRDAVLSGEALDADALTKLEEDILPTLTSEIGDFDAEAFVQGLQEGSAEALEMLNQYEKFANEDIIDQAYEAYTEEKENLVKLQEQLVTAEENEKAEIQAQIKEAEKLIAVKQLYYENILEELETYEGLTELELKRLDIEAKIAGASNDDLQSKKELVEAYRELVALAKEDQEEWYNNLSKTSGVSDSELKEYITMVNGKIKINSKWYNELSTEQKRAVDNALESGKEIASDLYDNLDNMSNAVDDYINKEVEAQDTLIEAYKSQLKEEKEALQNSLDARKDMYDKYFDSLDDEDEEEDFEEQQQKLQNKIAKLSGATDTTSQTLLKEAMEELEELEDDRRQTERDNRRDAVSEMLDNQSEMIDQYYEERLENEEQLWSEIMSMSDDAMMIMLQSYTDGFSGATTLAQSTMLAGFAETIQSVRQMLGGSTTKIDDYLANYDAWRKAYAEDSSIGAFNPNKKYAAGGLVDYTGTAWVDGTPSKPEAFLSADQTALFAQLANSLTNFYARSSYSGDSEGSGSTVTIENFTVAVDATLTDNNVQETGNSLADALLEGLKRTGITVNMKK